MSNALTDAADAVVSYVVRPFVFLLSHLVPRNDRVWVFTADWSGRFAENTKYLFLYAAEQSDGVRPIWIARDREVLETLRARGYEAFHIDDRRGKYAVLRARCVFSSHSIPFWPYVGGAQVVQTWHGNALKRLGRDLELDASPLVRLYRKYIVRNWNWFVTTGTADALAPFASAFGISDDEVIPSGYPRNDVFFRDVEGATVGLDSGVYDRLRDLSDDATLVSYMPTSRRAFHEDAGVIDGSRLDVENLNRLLADHDAYLLLKAHPWSDVEIDEDEFDRLVMLPNGIDIYPILPLVDVLVTDYSSIYFDYLLLDRPVVFYSYDLDAYRDARGLYFEYDDVTPGPKATTSEELHEWLDHFLRGEDGFEESRAQVRDRFYRHRDGRASERIYRHVRNVVRGASTDRPDSAGGDGGRRSAECETDAEQLLRETKT
ncbi:CDP-glycerol glycerophosphotransferase family protein [Halorussus salinisoli]|uniref:CDP-glycerol glycerophosphotransferase family protein n=1 Tax=Halorussus salinisoli TaxID=2558242 RepID=UPI0010C16895|nr:CDP-glycerol glycerophosphotransferase family protein [Halorussus salinisoli]